MLLRGSRNRTEEEEKVHASRDPRESSMTPCSTEHTSSRSLGPSSDDEEIRSKGVGGTS